MSIGIDLGTTNCTLSFENKGRIETFETLPSFVFFPPAGGEVLVGERAKERGAEVPDRVISSAKSWLSHEGIDRRDSFLPLGECEEKMSPVQACALYLKQLKERFGEFEEKQLFVTVPASFDPSARELVEEATQLAGFSALLIEEPLAAFYDWLHRHEENWRDHLSVGDRVLVVDIGGGTTDFSLICVLEREGNLELERSSVGEHLLLGGDNLDLALAYVAKEKLGPLDEWQFASLIHRVREAKEQLLAGAEEVTVTIAGRGSALIGGSLKCSLSKAECEQVLVEGFFPLVSFDEKIEKEQRLGLTTLTLPYVQDPRITVHLAQFLKEHPTKVLFNGGTMKGAPFQKRIVEQLSAWRGERVEVLPDADLDWAVSRGAAYYGKSGGIRVKAPSARSYYIGIEGAAPAVPGIMPTIKPVCVVPHGMEEGSEKKLDQVFTLRLGEPVFFRFFSHPSSNEEREIETLTELHPIETLLESEEESFVRVHLSAKLTELGMLELWCLSEKEKWKLEFNLRQETKELVASS
ncbi:MAG: Chaperone protein DnaK [Chlamydiales bacterium]|nr:Chaperone protein DnaK [Chlamydiales bacterium]MCH9619187.1 Chaperone protein DnaK [Chlamydiales bacterium]MCH9622449.1 Chaperone protein DnaK [Chlamydiales bacterium]